MRRATLGIIAVLGLAFPAQGEPWTMVGKEPSHSASVIEGPEPPLKRSWIATGDDPHGTFTTWPIVTGEVVYARAGSGVMAADARSGRRIWWTQPEEGQAQVSPAVDNDRLYTVLPAGRVLALDRETGGEVWRFRGGEESSLDPSGTLADGRFYFGLFAARSFYALNASDGSLHWKVDTELGPDSAPAVADGIVVLSMHGLGSPRSLVVALDAETGRELWRIEQTVGNSGVSIFDGKVVFGGGDFLAHAVDLRTGREVWSAQMEDMFGVKNMPALAFGDVFLADRVGNIYRLDGVTGERKWRLPTSQTEGTMNQSFPVVAGKTLYIGSGSGHLYGVDVDTGRIVWRDRVRGIVLSGAADAERFYFGVKLGEDEGLHAYEHDPEGSLEPPPSRIPRSLLGLVGGLAIFALLFGGIVVYARRRRG